MRGHAQPGQSGVAWWVVGAVIGVGLLGVTVAGLVWWSGYRHSTEQNRHRLLARHGVVAQRSELKKHVSAKVILHKAGQYRPTLASRATQGRAHALAPIMFPELVTAGLAVEEAIAITQGRATTSDDEAYICARIADTYELGPTPFQPGVRP